MSRSDRYKEALKETEKLIDLTLKDQYATYRATVQILKNQLLILEALNQVEHKVMKL